MDHEERASRSPRTPSSALLGSETRKMIAGRVPGHASERDASRASSVITIVPSTRVRYASGMRLPGAGLVVEKASTGAATGPRRKYGRVFPVTPCNGVTREEVRDLRKIAKGDSIFRFL